MITLRKPTDSKRYSGFYFGLPGTGATTLALKDAAKRKPLVVALASSDAITAPFVQVNDAQTWNEVYEAVTNKGIASLGDFDTLIVDGAGQLVTLLLSGLLANPTDTPSQQTWGKMSTLMDAQLRRLKGAVDYLVYTTHTREADAESGERYDVNPAVFTILAAHLANKVYTYTLYNKVTKEVYYGAERRAALAMQFVKTSPTKESK